MLLPWVRCYFNFSSEVLTRTSSHMWGRWYLPMFLLRDGLLTLMYNASLIVLLRFWSSLPTILKLSIVTWWPLMLLWSNIGECTFWCSLNLSAKVLEDSPMYSSSQSTLPHLNLVDDPTLFEDWIFIFGGHQEAVDGFTSFEIHLYGIRCRFLILLVESWSKVVISGTVHWFDLKTSFHPLLWTSSGLRDTWKLSAYIGLGSLNQYKHLVSRYPSDLKKSTVVDESLSSNQTNVLFQRLQLYFKTVCHVCYRSSWGSHSHPYDRVPPCRALGFGCCCC